MLKQFHQLANFRGCFQTVAFFLLEPDGCDFDALKSVIIYPTCANIIIKYE